MTGSSSRRHDRALLDHPRRGVGEHPHRGLRVPRDEPPRGDSAGDPRPSGGSDGPLVNEYTGADDELTDWWIPERAPTMDSAAAAEEGSPHELARPYRARVVHPVAPAHPGAAGAG